MLVIDEESTDNLIHFVRFLKELKKEQCKIILQCNQQSQTLMSQQSWIDNVVDHEHYPDHDYHVQIGSIMNVLKFNPNHHEHRFPYLKINDKSSDLIIDDNLNVGVMWEASRDSNAHDDNSINPESFESIFKENENVICLDKKINKDNKPDFVNKVAEYSDLLELAQIIKQLDIVLTVDHTIVHLAGALDISTILMLPCIPNWRWDMNHRNTSPWYKSLKIYRQQMPGDWSYVLNKVSKSLLEMKMAEFLIDQALKEAIDLHNRNQLDEAKSIYLKIINHDNKNSDAHHLLSLIYLVEGKLEDAKSIVSAIDLQPDIAVYHSNYGNILYHGNNLEFAIQEHKRAIKLDKKNFQSYYGLGIIYSHLKNFEKSEENYLKAISIDSESQLHTIILQIYTIK